MFDTCLDVAVPGADADVTAAVVKDANAMESARSANDPVAMLVTSVAKQLRPDKQRALELRRIFAGGFVGVARPVFGPVYGPCACSRPVVLRRTPASLPIPTCSECLSFP